MAGLRKEVPMYTEEDYRSISRQFRNRSLSLWIPLGVFAVLIFVLAIRRVPEVFVMIATILAGGLAIFVFGLFIKPVLSYKRHMDNCLHGRTHDVTGAFKEMGEETVDKDGVRFWPMILNVGNMEDEEDDRLLYYDANLPRPGFVRGQMLTVSAHDKAVAKWTDA